MTWDASERGWKENSAKYAVSFEGYWMIMLRMNAISQSINMSRWLFEMMLTSASCSAKRRKQHLNFSFRSCTGFWSPRVGSNTSTDSVGCSSRAVRRSYWRGSIFSFSLRKALPEVFRVNWIKTVDILLLNYCHKNCVMLWTANRLNFTRLIAWSIN